MSLAALIREERESILAEWEQIVTALDSARHLPRPALRNHMPMFLDWLVARLEHLDTGASFPHDQALEHANERVDAGYDLSDVISEYAILRDVLHEAWEQHPDALERPRELRMLNEALDDAIAFTAVFYARVRLFRERGYDPGRGERERLAPDLKALPSAHT